MLFFSTLDFMKNRKFLKFLLLFAVPLGVVFYLTFFGYSEKFIDVNFITALFSLQLALSCFSYLINTDSKKKVSILA